MFVGFVCCQVEKFFVCCTRCSPRQTEGKIKFLGEIELGEERGDDTKCVLGPTTEGKMFAKKMGSKEGNRQALPEGRWGKKTKVFP